MRLQNTIKSDIFITGLGLHCGSEINMRLRPAPVDTGIIFIRTDKNNARIKANVSSVSDTTFATTLGVNGSRVGTVEHLLAALAGMDVDNAYVELDGPEVPILDGSALPFVLEIINTGITQQVKFLSVLRILEPIVVNEGAAQIAITPYEGRRITYRVCYTHPAFGEQKLGIDMASMKFESELAPAKTFGFLKDVEMLRSRGLAKGGTLDNAIVLGDTGVINEHMLRFEDEFVRHKIIDAIGDMSLLGIPIYGHIIADKSGHALHVKLLRKILLCKDSWEIVAVTKPQHSYPVSEVAEVQVCK